MKARARNGDSSESAAHQLRTPLTGIQAQLELMAADEADASKQQRLMAILDARAASRTPPSNC